MTPGTSKISWTAIAAVAALVLPAADSEAGDSTWQAQYHVAFRDHDGEPPTAAVEVVLRWIAAEDSTPSEVGVSMAEDGFPGGYGAHVHRVTAFVPPASPPPPKPHEARVLDAPAGRYRIPVLADGVAAYRYDVVLDHDPQGYGPGADEAPYAFQDGAFWTGRALFLTAPGSSVELILDAPPGEHVSVSYEPVPHRPGHFTVPDEGRLRESFLMVGRHAVQSIQVGDAHVTLALGESLRPSMPVLATAIGQFLDASTRVFGGAPPGRILVAGNATAPSGSMEGGTFGDDVSFLVDGPLDADNASRWKPFLCHEVFHLWNGRALEFEGQQYWFSEGMTDYYARLLLVRLGQMSGDDFLADLRQRASRYLSAAGTLGLQAAGDAKFDHPELVYVGGSLAGLCLDLEIRRGTRNERSLDSVMAGLYRDFATSPHRRIRADALQGAVETAAGHSMRDFFARHIEGREPLPLAAELEHAAMRVSIASAALPEVGAIAGTLLRCPSITGAGGTGLTILKSKLPPIEPGDILVEVEGTPVRGFEDLRRAFAALAPGTEIDVVVQRGGRPMPLRVTLGGDPATVVPRSRVTTVDIEPLAGGDAVAIAVRDAIFGRDLTPAAADRSESK